jgi:transposase
MTGPHGMPVGQSNKLVYDTSRETGKPLTTHQWNDGTQHPWEFKRVWHLEPTLTDPDAVYAGGGYEVVRTHFDPQSERIYLRAAVALMDRFR